MPKYKLCHVTLPPESGVTVLKQNPTYLYQFKNSSNYFFRISLNFFKKMGYHHVDGHFVASLKTSDYEDAKFLALYIKRMIDKEFSMEAKKFSYEPMGSGCFEAFSHSVAEIGNTLNVELQRSALQKKLRKKFNRLYQTGLQLIDEGYGHEPDHIITLSKEQKTLLERKIKDADEHARSMTAESPEGKPASLSKDQASHISFSTDTESDLVQSNAQAMMLANLMDALMHKASNYKTNDVNVELTQSRLIEFASALYDQRNIKAGLEKELVAEAPKPNKDYTIDNQLSLFLSEKKQELGDKTINGYRAKFAVFFEIIDKDFDVRKFSKLEVQKIKSRLIERNANETKGADTKKMSAKTINMYLSNYRTFFAWLKGSVDGIHDNPFKGVSLRENKKNLVKRRAFTTQEIKNQLSYTFQHGSEAKEFRNDAQWYVPIAIYSGMRLNEISELTTKNVVKIDDVWCFDLIGMEVKNEPSNRIVPIAQYLLDKGILNYVANLNSKYKSKGEVLLFPQIRKNKKEAGKSGWGESISRWFNRTALENMGIDFDEEKRRKTTVCFHCIRHTFITKLVNAGCQTHHIKRIVGHSVEDDVTLSVYSNVNNIPLKLLKSEMDKHLTWHLEAIKN